MTDERQEANDAIGAFKAKYGEEIAIFKTSFGYLIFQKPEQDVFEEFLDITLQDKSKKSVAMRSMVQQCALEPDLDVLVQIFKKRAGLPSVIAARLVEMCQEDVEDLAKKG